MIPEQLLSTFVKLLERFSSGENEEQEVVYFLYLGMCLGVHEATGQTSVLPRCHYLGFGEFIFLFLK
jgi:hypothetical protein